MEKRSRSVAKSVSWRVVAFINTTLVAFVFTGDVSVSLGVSLTANLIAIGLYYVHERVWAHNGWGYE